MQINKYIYIVKMKKKYFFVLQFMFEEVGHMLVQAGLDSVQAGLDSVQAGKDSVQPLEKRN